MTVVADRPATALPSPGRRENRWAWPLQRMWRGPADDPAWARPALLVLLVGTATAYLWAMGSTGWANSYYAAAVQAGLHSGKAFFFGSADAANFITVDKPPASLWLMGVSARLFGFGAWSILLPQALEGVATVAVLYATVRRWFSPGAGLLAGFVMATTPVAALMFRFDDPDALLTLLLVVAAYATVRAIEQAQVTWIVVAGAAVGAAFLTKMMQALLVVPALALAYLVAAPGPVNRRIRALGAAAAALVISAGWWIAAVQLTPPAQRPYIGGTEDNNLVSLIFGYNGIGRLSGNEASGGVADVHTAHLAVGPMRLFARDMGGQVSWLLPAALVFLVVLLWQTRGRPRADRTRAAMIVFGGWLVVTGAVLSLGQGIIHPYYTVVLVPPIAAIVGVGGSVLWAQRQRRAVRWTLALVLDVTVAWAFLLFSRTVVWLPWLAVAVLATGVATAVLLTLTGCPTRRGAILVAGAGVLAAVAGPLAYTVNTINSSHTGGDPRAGPPLLFSLPDPLPPSPGPRLVRLLRTDAGRYRWTAAVVSSRVAAGYQLATGDAVMGVGGFHGSLPIPAPRAFETDVRTHRIHYFVVARDPGSDGTVPSDASARTITRWVERHYQGRTVDGVRIYDLTSARPSPPPSPTRSAVAAPPA